MATEVETPVATNVVSTADHLKAVFVNMSEQSVQLKALMLTVKNLIKDVEKQSKEFDKLRNKKSRNRSERKASDTPSGITKPVAISDELARFLGVEPGTLVPRNEVTKGVSSYVRKYELSDPQNKQKFLPGDKPEGAVLMKLLGNPEESVTYFNLQRYLKHHYISVNTAESDVSKASTSAPKDAKVKAAAPVVEAPTTSNTPATSEPVAEKKKVKIIKKKKEPSSELSEEA
jgi:chromatin remodeling complex protein RSC6